MKYDEVYVTIFVIAAIVGAVFSIHDTTFLVTVFVAIILGLFMASVIGLGIIIPIMEMLGLMEE